MGLRLGPAGRVRDSVMDANRIAGGLWQYPYYGDLLGDLNGT
jgi:hypothetical protein